MGNVIGGGCATFIREGISFREVRIGNDLKFVTIEIWTSEGNLQQDNIYVKQKNKAGRIFLIRLVEQHLWEMFGA